MYVIYGSNIEHEKHDTDCPDCDTAGEGDRSLRRDIAKVCYIEIRHMYDDIAYSKDDIGITEFIRIG